MLFLFMSATNSLHVAVVLSLLEEKWLCWFAYAGITMRFSAIKGQTWHCDVM